MHPQARQAVLEILVQQRLAGTPLVFRKEMEEHGITEAEVEAEANRRQKQADSARDPSSPWAVGVVVVALILIALYFALHH